MSEPFIEGWNFISTLGEGAYGEVKLAVSTLNNDKIAVKIISLNERENFGENVTQVENCIRKEAALHNMLQHKHVIRFYGHRKDKDMLYLFLEYASNGELFDKIEPDVGMTEKESVCYFIQLLSGIDYLHSKGVAHRDIKPENLLLDENDVLKICDFGMATLFRYQGKERKLQRRCGTAAYTAPEVLKEQLFSAIPADIWSCGMVLVSMLCGEHPWEEATNRDPKYVLWKREIFSEQPWSKISQEGFTLLKQILNPIPEIRFNSNQIRQHRWIKKISMSTPQLEGFQYGMPKKRRRCEECGPSFTTPSLSTQPAFSSDNLHPPSLIEDCNLENIFPSVFFSQPLNSDDVILNSQFCTTQTQTQAAKGNYLAKRLTRIYMEKNVKEATKEMFAIFTEMNYSPKSHFENANSSMRLTTIDNHGRLLSITVSFYEIDYNMTLVDFRRSRGDGLEFKRRFNAINKRIKDIRLQQSKLLPTV